MCDSLRINGTFLLVKNTYPEHHVSINFLCTTAASGGEGGKIKKMTIRYCRHNSVMLLANTL